MARRKHRPLRGGVVRLCEVPDCGGKHVAKGLCRMHYARLDRTGTIELTNFRQTFSCTLPGCTATSQSGGLCHNHWMTAYRMRHAKDLKQLALDLFPVGPLVAEIERTRISHKELARRSQVPRRTILRVLTGQTHVTFHVADRLSYALGTHPIFLWGTDWIRVSA